MAPSLTFLVILSNSGLFVLAGNSGDDFTDNLFTDLAPLLSLFGEKFAQQFLSECFTFAERILFAMAPLGVLTAIVGAIRVKGAPWLKRVIGRARENTGLVELKLKSSVSHDVCELWNGDLSPRSFITLDKDTWSEGYELSRYPNVTDSKAPSDMSSKHARDSVSSGAGSKSETEASPKQETRLEDHAASKLSAIRNSKKVDHGSGLTTGSDTDADVELRSLANSNSAKIKGNPPNLSLNIHGETNPMESIAYAMIATSLQCAVLGWAGFVAYSPYAHSNIQFTSSKSSVGFSLFAAGTFFLTWSLILCAGIIDNDTSEQYWIRKGKNSDSEKRKSMDTSPDESMSSRTSEGDKSSEAPLRPSNMRLCWIQEQHTAGDNFFDRYILIAGKSQDKIYESHRNDSLAQQNRKGIRTRVNQALHIPLSLYMEKTTFAVIIGILGFVAQFQGLRFSNWTCSIAQLIAIGTATALRAFLRRGMTKTPRAFHVDNAYLLDHLTLAVTGEGFDPFDSASSGDQPHLMKFPCGVAVAPQIFKGPIPTSSTPSKPQEALDLRVRLGKITKWQGPMAGDAKILADAIETAFDYFNFTPPEGGYIFYGCYIQIGLGDEEHVRLRLRWSLPALKWKWEVNDAELEALLSLISYSALYSEGKWQNHDNSTMDSSMGWLRQQNRPADAKNTNFFHRAYHELARFDIRPDEFYSNPQDIVGEVKANDNHGSFTQNTTTQGVVMAFYGENNSSSPRGSYMRAARCGPHRVVILHIFSAFIWAASRAFPDDILNKSQLLPRDETKGSEWSQLFSDTILKRTKVDGLVRQLENLGLGTSREIYEVLIPPFSYFDLIPNKALAQDIGEMVQNTEENSDLKNVLWYYREIINMIEVRGRIDRFAIEVGKFMEDSLGKFDDKPDILKRAIDLAHSLWDKMANHGRELDFLKGRDVLHYTVLNNHILATTYHLQKGWHVNTQDKDKRTPLSYAAEEGLQDMVKLLLAQPGIEVNLADSKNMSPLSYATKNGKDKTIALLLDRAELDVNAKDKDGICPLTQAVLSRNKEAIKLLLAHPNIKVNTDDDKRTPLSYAAMDEENEFVELLLSHPDIDVNTSDPDRRSPLSYAAQRGRGEIVGLLLAYPGITVNVVDKEGRSPLSYAAQYGYVEIVGLLLAHTSIVVNLSDTAGRSPLLYAAQGGHVEIVGLLLAHPGTEINARDTKGRTPLWYAAYNMEVEVIKLLLERPDIQVNVKGTSFFDDDRETTPLEEAEKNDARYGTVESRVAVELLRAYRKPEPESQVTVA